uniref:Large ribosomal subunit protein uL10m n=1 Tax=Lepeophtheirus salmonis TaxID=72036 RepID=C1BUR1_LEPSM|nr:39S ribosomal protein L10, mitochondrial precursor [Lepeophtheirus salmonis]
MFPSLRIPTRSMSRRVSIPKAREPSFFRRKLLAFSAPSYPQDDVSPTTERIWEKCSLSNDKMVERHVPNELEILYGQQMLELFSSSPVIGFYHINYLSYDNKLINWQNARRLDMELKDYNRRSCKAVLPGTKWEKCLHFVESCRTNQYMTFGPDIETLPNLIKFEKKTPELILIGAVAYDKILRRQDVLQISSLPDIQVLYSQLASILTSPQRQTLSYLGSGASGLSQNLSQFLKDQS